MQKKLKQVENTTETTERVLNLVLAYRRMLEDSNQSYPKDFWISNIEEKAENLMREYASRKNIRPKQVP